MWNEPPQQQHKRKNENKNNTNSTKNGYLSDLGERMGDAVEDGFRVYGQFVGRHPGAFLIGTLVFTALCAPGLTMIRINLDLYKLFVPLDAPVRFEFESQQAYNQIPPGIIENDPVVATALPRHANKSGTVNDGGGGDPPLRGRVGGAGENGELLIEESRPASARLGELPTSEDALRLDTRRNGSAIAGKTNAAIESSALRRRRRHANAKPPIAVKVPKHKPNKAAALDAGKGGGAGAPIHNDILRFYVVHKNYDNLLESRTLSKLYDYTNEMMKTTVKYGGKEWPFERFCKKAPTAEKCNNDLNVWLKHAENLFKSSGSRVNPNLQLSYPVMYLFNRPKDIGNIIYGVNVTGEKHEIVGARVLTIHWFVAFPKIGDNLQAYFAYRERLNDFWAQKTELSDIKFIPHNDKAMDDELRLIIETAVPFAIPATIQLMIFVYVTNIAKDIRKSKSLEAFFGVICVCLGLLATFGVTFYCGLPFNPVSSTMPFLILAVGVDDAFLMLGAWRTSDPRLSVERRMGIMMSDAGASITVTSLTNFGCFALGYYLSPTPAVGDFCILTAVGVIFDYFYQITFFAAIMVYSGLREKEGGLKVYFRWGKKSREAAAAAAIADDPAGEERKALASYNEPMFMHRFLKEHYAPFILRREVKALSWAVYIIFVCVSFYGCSNMRVDISPKKYIRDNSPIQTFVHLADKYIWADNVMPTFHIMRPPDFRNASQRVRFNELIFRLENTKYSIGRVSTNLWIWEYQNFLNDFPEVDVERDFYNRAYLRNFFHQFDYQQLRGSVKFNDSVADGEPSVVAFTFQTSFYGLDSWDKRQAELFHWRRILAEFPEFRAFLAGIFSPFLIDQRRTIAPSSMQSVGSAIAVMALISLFFLPDKQSVFIMSFSLISISTGVCGFLCLWGSDLDSVSMGCIIMAIGLAVDFSIHICYRYHRCVGAVNADAKVIETLSIVGYPILQAGASTLWAMTTLPLIPAYLVRVFFQTVVLVNVIGLLHALVWLPQFISSLDPIERVPRRIKYPHGE